MNEKTRRTDLALSLGVQKRGLLVLHMPPKNRPRVLCLSGGGKYWPWEQDGQPCVYKGREWLFVFIGL